eukprot:gene26152-32687_t
MALQFLSRLESWNTWRKLFLKIHSYPKIHFNIYNAKRFSVDLSLFPVTMRVYEACMLLDIFTATAPEAMPDCPPPVVVA